MLSLDFHCKENDGFWPYLYTQDSQDMLDSTNSDLDFTNTIITGDESWVYGYDPKPVIFLTIKSDESTKQYLTQMLVGIN